MERAFTYEVVERIAVLSESGDTSKELNRVSYNGSPAKYDLRSWRRADGEEKLLKGLTLTDEKPAYLRKLSIAERIYKRAGAMTRTQPQPEDIIDALADEASREYQRQADEAEKDLQKLISPLWDDEAGGERGAHE